MTDDMKAAEVEKRSKRQGFMVYHSDLRNLDELTDQEFRAVIMALVDFSETGEIPKLSAGARIAFGFLSDKVSRDAENYRKKCEQNSANARSRRAEKQPESTASDRMPPEATAGDRMPNVPTGTGTRGGTHGESGTRGGSGSRSSSDELTSGMSDDNGSVMSSSEFDSKDELSKAMKAALDAGLPTNKADERAVGKMIAEYSLDWVLQAIERTTLRTNRCWGTTKAILKSWKQKGGIDDEALTSRRHIGKPVGFQVYEQPSDNEPQFSVPDLLKEAREQFG